MRKKREKMNFYDKNFSKLMKACFFLLLTNCCRSRRHFKTRHIRILGTSSSPLCCIRIYSRYASIVSSNGIS